MRTPNGLLRAALLVLALPASTASIAAQDVPPGATSKRQDPGLGLDQKKRRGLGDPAASFWIYDDVEAGYAKAKTSGMPLLVSFRCVP